MHLNITSSDGSYNVDRYLLKGCLTIIIRLTVSSVPTSLNVSGDILAVTSLACWLAVLYEFKIIEEILEFENRVGEIEYFL